MAKDDLVKVALINTIVQGSPGEVLTAFGHAFTIQPNGEAHAFVEQGFVKDEVAAGRYVVIDGQDPGAVPMPKKDLLIDSNLGFEVSNYYGTKDINALTKAISDLDKDQVKMFAETRLQLNFPDSMSRVKMVDKITKIVRKQVVPPKEETPPEEKNDTMAELEKLEKDIKAK